MKFNLSSAKIALIIGAGHGIGLALIKQLLTNFSHIHCIATYRNKDNATSLIELNQQNQHNLSIYKLDPTNDAELKSFFSKIIKEAKLDLCINCCGLLHTDKITPEKSLKDINKQQLLDYFEVNAIITPLLAKYAKSCFSTQKPSVFATISAKVGSIEDNALGGWYGYRASKAALNMFIKNIAIEFKQSQLKTIVYALHPGTTITNLSQPFLSHIKHQVFTAEDTAKHLINIINDASIEKSGSFLSWDNTSIPW